MIPTRKTAGFVLCGLISVASAWAGSRTSANYSILADTVDSGGKSAASANYSQIGSLGLLAGISTAPSGTQIRAGYVAQVNADAVQALSAVSRKTHGTAGTFDVNLPLSGLAGVECRAAGSGSSYQVIVTFATPVSLSGVSVMSRDGLAGATTSASGATVTVNLTSVVNAQTLGISLLQVNNGSTANDVFVSMGVLLGDTNGDGIVNGGDAIQTRSRSGQPTDATNLRSDVNVDGLVNGGDAIVVRARSGTSLP
ncbi:MAG: dockerin type I domain-containing protein [Chthoniobacterales bacterium]